MKKLCYILLSLFMCACSFNKITVKHNKENLIFISNYLITNNIKSISLETLKDKKIKSIMKKIGIKNAGLGNSNKYNYNEPIDSVVVFSKHVGIFDIKFSRIVYDYSIKPHILKDTIIKNYSYVLKTIDDRFYISNNSTSR